tara:strand:- start:228 stop:482 length:255 start_codon:yes stop_codon:yes gene_type:complete
MKNLIFAVIIFCLTLNTYSFSSEDDCNGFKKFSVNYMTCKANFIKNKTLSTGKNFVNDTKNFQKKEWSKEKNKLNDLKEKVLEK